MTFKYSILIFILISFLLGCKTLDKTRGFYNINESEYDLVKARQQLNDLKNGILIVSIPTERQKLRILKNTDTEKYNETISEVNEIKKSIILAMSTFYKFSEYVLIPDTSLVKFTHFNENQHFLLPDGSPMLKNSIDTSDNYFILKCLRDFDHFFIYQKDNTYPNKPFPYNSTIGTLQIISSKDYVEKLDIKDRNNITEALFIVSKRLDQTQ